jgi:hypothetical protein
MIQNNLEDANMSRISLGSAIALGVLSVVVIGFIQKYGLVPVLFGALAMTLTFSPLIIPEQDYNSLRKK